MRSLLGLLILLPALVHAQEETWFPLQEGNTWVYASKVTIKVKVPVLGRLKKKVNTNACLRTDAAEAILYLQSL